MFDSWFSIVLAVIAVVFLCKADGVAIGLLRLSFMAVFGGSALVVKRFVTVEVWYVIAITLVLSYYFFDKHILKPLKNKRQEK